MCGMPPPVYIMAMIPKGALGGAADHSRVICTARSIAADMLKNQTNCANAQSFSPVLKNWT